MTVAPTPCFRRLPLGHRLVLFVSFWSVLRGELPGGPARPSLVRAPLLAAGPSHDLTGDRVGDLVICAELHGVRGPALGPRTQVGSVAEHVAQRHQSPHDMAGAPLFHALDL